MEEVVIKHVGDILELTDKYGNLEVIGFLVIVFFGGYLVLTKNTVIQVIIIGVFSIMALSAFVLFGMQFKNEKLLKQDKVVRSTPETNTSKLENKEKKILSENSREDKQNSSEKIESEKMSNEEDISSSLENTVLDFIENMNQRTEKGYNNSYNFIERYLPKSMTKENYVGYWNNNKAQFILSDINESNHSFSVIIDFDESSAVDLFNTYKVLEDNYKWYIEDKTQKKLQNFDKWKINGNEKLHFIFEKEIIKKGKTLYTKKPSLHSKHPKKNNGEIMNLLELDTIVKAYVHTNEGYFYLSEWSFEALTGIKTMRGEARIINWIYGGAEY